MRPTSVSRYDPMHTMFSNGIVGLEIMQFLKAAKAKRRTYFKEVHSFIASGWLVRSQVKMGCRLKDVFAPAREALSDTMLKAMAFEILAIYPVFRFYVETQLRCQELEKEIDSLLVLFESADLVMGCIRGQPLNAREADSIASALEFINSTHLEAFKRAYGSGAVIPKHHFNLHVPSQLRADGRLLSCWTLERKHKCAKRLN